jgi:CRISPR-associated protein Csc3
MPPKTAQDEKPVAVYLYPTYFFTAETAYVIKLFIQELSDLSMLNLIFKHLEPNGFTTEQILTYEQFTLDEQQARQTQRRVFSLKKPRYGDDDPAGLFFFTLRPPMKDPTDTDAWIVPTFYALALPLLLNLKVVVSSSFVPIYASGAEFRQTALLDGPHGFTKYVLPSDHLHVNDLTDALLRLLRLYELHLDVFSEPKDMHWGMLNAVAKDVATDPLAVFSYYDRKQRAPKEETAKGKGKAKAKSQPKSDGGDAIPPYVVERYMAIYHTLRRDTVTSFIAQLVDDYAAFYHADYAHLGSAYTVLRPLGTAIDVTKNSSPDSDDDTLILLIAGTTSDELDRVRNDPATSGGFDPIWTDKSRGTPAERLDISRQAIGHFARQFVTLCFKEYCKGDRGILRERANRIRSAANFYYLSQPYARRSRPDTGSSNATTTPKE